VRPVSEAAVGTSYLVQKDVRKASAAFNEITTTIDSISDATVRPGLRRLYGQAELGRAAVAELDDDAGTSREILKKALAPSKDSSPQFTRSTVLLQFARLERSAQERPTETLHLYEEAIQAFHDEKDSRTEISARMQLIRFLAVESPTLEFGNLAWPTSAVCSGPPLGR
jgi:hypothetical protein